MKVNVDGAYDKDSGKAAGGYVIRKNDATVLGIRGEQFQAKSPMQAEALALRLAAQVCKEKNLDAVIRFDRASWGWYLC